MYVQLSAGGWTNAASFQLRGPRLEPAAVTRALGIEPSLTATRGEPRTRDPARTYRTGAWSLKSEPVLSRVDDHLDDHLRWLLDQLEPRAQQLRAVVAEQELGAEFWCVISMESANVDLELQPETVGRVGALGALRLDIYAPEDVEPESIEIPEPGATRDPSDPD